MKKITIMLILFLILPFKVYSISASSAIVMDLNSGRVLYKNNINDEKLIASTTKIMTCLVAIRYGNLDQIVKVDEDVLKAYGSAIYIEVGEEITLRDLLYGLMLRSGNDAAIEIANAVSGSMQSFVYLMNDTAKSIGMNNTVFYNNHGLEESDGRGNLSTAYDMALLTREAMQDETFRKIFGTKNYVSKSSYKTYTWTSKNKLIHRYDYITGGKTGYTEKARRTLVTTASLDNKNLVVVTLNDPNDFQDHIELYESIFSKYQALKVLDKNNFNIEKETYYKTANFKILNDYYALVTDKEKDDLKLKIELKKIKDYRNNQVVGEAKIYLNDELLHSENVYIEKIEDQEKLSFFEKLVRWFKSW